MNSIVACTAVSILFYSMSLSAFESTTVLPKGIRNISIRTINTETKEKSDSNGGIIPLADPLYKPLKFKNIISSEKSVLKRKEIEAFLKSEGWSKNDSVGDFFADLDAQINVWAPIVSFGVTDKLTMGVAIPVYSVSTDVEVGFRTNEMADRFLRKLQSPLVNRGSSAIEAHTKLTNAIPRLNEKLEDNGYRTLKKWSAIGLGDITFLSKYLVLNESKYKVATALGFVAPTGRVDDPDNLTDLAFGDGQWDLFSQLYFDQYLSPKLFFNQYVKYTYQAPSKKIVRDKTADETIEVEKSKRSFKLGDKVDAGFSVQYEQDQTGIKVGAGFLYNRKFSDRYDARSEVRDELQKDTEKEAGYWKAMLGYSSLAAFRKGEAKIPFMSSIEYRRQMFSVNSPKTDFTQVDVRVFF